MFRVAQDLLRRTVVTLPALVLLAAWQLQSPDWPLRLIVLAILVLAFLRPAASLIVLVTLAPAASIVSVSLGGVYASGPFVEQLAWAVIAGSFWHRQPSGLLLAGPAALLAASALASAAVIFPTLALKVSPDAGVLDWARRLLLEGEYFGRQPTTDPLYFALLWAQSAAVAVLAEARNRARPDSWRGLAIGAVAGTAGAIAISALALVSAALQSATPLDAAREMMVIFRFSILPDVNAAASLTALVLSVAVALWWPARGAAARGAIAVAIVTMLVGLWMAGSRSAPAALLVTAVAGYVLWLTHHHRWTWRTVAAGAVVLAVAIAVLGLHPRAHLADAEGALVPRWIMVLTTVQMTLASPAFGIGIGRFMTESVTYGAQALEGLGTLTAWHENAHNNFLQVLGELGLVGFWILLAVLGVLVAGTRTVLHRAHHEDRAALAIAVGTSAFVLTCLSGHPWLVRESSLLFWTFAGVVAAAAPTMPRRWIWAPLTVLLLATIPFRAADYRANADLEHLALNLSGWQRDSDQPYRSSVGDFSLFVPANGTPLRIHMRLPEGSTNVVTIAVVLDGRVIDTVRLENSEWHPLRLIMPDNGRRYERVDFRIDPGGATVHVARVVAFE